MVLLIRNWAVVPNDNHSVHINPLLEVDSLGVARLVVCVRLHPPPMTGREPRGGQIDRSFSLPL